MSSEHVSTRVSFGGDHWNKLYTVERCRIELPDQVTEPELLAPLSSVFSPSWVHKRDIVSVKTALLVEQIMAARSSLSFLRKDLGM